MELLPQGAINGVILGGIYMLVAVGLALIFGTMRLVNFAHGPIFMLAMYLVYFAVVSWGLGLYVALLLSVPVMFLSGFLIYFVVVHPVISKPPEALLLVMIGFALLLESSALVAFSPQLRSVPDPFSFEAFRFGNIVIGYAQVIAAVSSLTVVAAVTLILYKTEIGRAIRAISEDRDAAQLAGIRIGRVNAIAFGLGTACLGVAAPLVMPFLSVSPGVGLEITLVGFLIIVMGGLGSYRGAMAAAVIVGLADGIGGILFPGAQQRALLYGLFIAVLLIKPTGLFGVERL